MKQGKTKAILLLTFMVLGDVLFAQSSGDQGSNWFVYLLLAAVVLLFFLIVIQVSDNMLAIEANRIGVDKRGDSFSIFPNFGDLFPKKTPAFAKNGPVHVLKSGHDILLEGVAKKEIAEDIQARTFAVQIPNFIGISPIPKVLVEVGDTVKAGDPLFFDKKKPAIQYCAPVSGEVIAIDRGAKRSIARIVILADKEQQYRSYPAFDLENGSREELVQMLLESGAWPMIRQRPFNVVPDATDLPRDIFISTFDSAPLAPDLNFVVEGQGEAFQKGLDVLNKLTDGTVFLGLSAREDAKPSDIFINAEGVQKHYFDGKHPAGNVGVQIHHIKPIGGEDKVWTLDVQTVITLGKLFTEQRFDTTKIVALTGAELSDPVYVKTQQGARINELLEGKLASEKVRFISGDVLSGEKKESDDFLNFYDDQITVVEEGDFYEMFGWLLPLTPRPSVSRTYPNFLLPDTKFKANTNTHGEQRAFVVTGQYEAMLPMDVYVQHLMKSILIGDIERMEGLGINELVEEDVALAEFACTSKQPLQQILRDGLDKMREES